MSLIGRRSALGVAAVAACLAATGCGDDASEGAATGTGLKSEPVRLVSMMASTAAKASKQKDCKEVAKVNLRSAVKVVCPPLTDGMRKANRGMKPVRAAVYGSAAVVDYVSPGAKDGASIILYRNEKGLWTIGRWGLLYGPTVGTDGDDRRAESRTAVDRYLAAVRDRDCDAYAQHAATSTADKRKVCENEFPYTRPLARLIADGHEVRYVDGNEDFAFYRVTGSGEGRRAYTVSTVANPKGALRTHIVLDAVVAPPS